MDSVFNFKNKEKSIFNEVIDTLYDQDEENNDNEFEAEEIISCKKYGKYNGRCVCRYSLECLLFSILNETRSTNKNSGIKRLNRDNGIINLDRMKFNNILDKNNNIDPEFKYYAEKVSSLEERRKALEDEMRSIDTQSLNVHSEQYLNDIKSNIKNIDEDIKKYSGLLKTPNNNENG